MNLKLELGESENTPFSPFSLALDEKGPNKDKNDCKQDIKPI